MRLVAEVNFGAADSFNRSSNGGHQEGKKERSSKVFPYGPFSSQCVGECREYEQLCSYPLLRLRQMLDPSKCKLLIAMAFRNLSTADPNRLGFLLRRRGRAKRQGKAAIEVQSLVGRLRTTDCVERKTSFAAKRKAPWSPFLSVFAQTLLGICTVKKVFEKREHR